MRGPDLKQRKLRPAPVRDGAMPSRAISRAEKRRRTNAWRARLIAEKRCVSCGKPSGPDGTKLYCRPHADQHARHERAKKLRKKLGAEAERQSVTMPMTPPVNRLA